MNLLLLTYYFPPEIGSASHLFFELGEYLSKKGFRVQVLTGFPFYNIKDKPKIYRGKVFLKEKTGDMEVFRVGSTHLPFARTTPILRGLEHFWLSKVFFLASLFVRKPDVILLYSPPLTLGLTAWALGKIKRTPFIINVQDLFPQSAIDLGLLRNNFLIFLFKKIEKFIYKSAAFVTVHSNQNKEYLKRIGIPETKIKLIPNWVDTDFIKPQKKENNKNFIVSFAGVLGHSQDLDIIIKVAKRLKKDKKIKFLIVGDGSQKKEAEEKARGLKNIQFLPMQPKKNYPKILANSDVCLATLKKEVKTPVVPSKILSIMAAARPIIASMDKHGDAPKLIKESKSGFALDAGDDLEMSNKILLLKKQPKLAKELGKNGRSYAEKHLSLAACVAKYEHLFKMVERTR